MRPLHELDDDAARLLSLILDESSDDNAGVDAAAFRAKHYDRIDAIGALESMGYVRKADDRYFVGLTALTQLDSPTSKQIMADAERLFSVLRTHYSKSQRTPLFIDSLSAAAKVSDHSTRVALSYMVEAPCWGGYTTSFFGKEVPNITPAESILGFKSFADAVRRLREWQAVRVHERPMSPRSTLAIESLLSQSSFPRPRDLFQKPDWVSQIPDTPRALLEEIYAALNTDLRALPAMGIRAVIDVVCVELVGDKGSFESRLDRIREFGQISQPDREHLAAAFDTGSASAHRGHIPNAEDLRTLVDTVERLLHGHYVLPAATQKMKMNTPLRPAKRTHKP